MLCANMTGKSRSAGRSDQEMRELVFGDLSMSWILRYRCRAFFRSSLCAVPMGGVAAALLAAPLIRSIDQRTHWTLMGFGAEGPRAVVGALTSSLLTFIVF